MFGGKIETVKFEADKDLLDVIYDKFGENTQIRPLGNGKISFTADVQISPVFFGWCCSFGERLKVISPQNVKQGLSEYLYILIESYKK